jgi:peptide chain release factor 1
MLTLLEWEEIVRRHEQLSSLLSSGSVDPQKRSVMQKEEARLAALLALKKQQEHIEHEQKMLREQRELERDADLIAMIDQEFDQLTMQYTGIMRALEDQLHPADPLDDRSVFLEIRAGAGGQEAALFAQDLMRMYMAYAIHKNWRVSITSISETDLKGLREVVLHIDGKGVYKHLKHESGVHRVQRVPITEGSGRVHTSTVTVAVLPEAEEVDIKIDPSDLRIDVYRSGGAGGQHVNTTDSAVRITHIPTGVVVTCQDERSQHKNKAKALKVLQSRLLVARQEKVDSERSLQRKEQVGTGMRSEKVRTYNFPQNRVTDHRVDVTLNKLDMVMEGDLHDVIEPLIEMDRRQRMSKPLEWAVEV